MKKVVFATGVELTKLLVFALGMGLTKILVQSIKGSVWWELLVP